MSTTWADVQNHMRSKFRLENDEFDMISMVWTYEEGRAQKIIIRRYSAFGREMIELKSPFAQKDDVDETTMLRKNYEMPLATVALSGDVYIVIYNLLLDHLDLGDFEFLVSRIAAVADTLEEKYARTDVF